MFKRAFLMSKSSWLLRAGTGNACSLHPPLEGVARELLELPDELLDITSVKIKHMYRPAIELAKEQGICSPELYACALPLKLKFKVIKAGGKLSFSSRVQRPSKS
jgi:hypothetical protein